MRAQTNESPERVQRPKGQKEKPVKVTIPQNYAQADLLMTTNPEGFKSLVVGRVAERVKFEEQEKQFTGDAPFVGIMLFRATQEIQRNPTNIAWAGQKVSKALNALFGKPLDKLTAESQCAVAYRLAYAGDNAPEKFATEAEAEKSDTLTRDKYFPESVYLKASAKTLRTLSRIFGRCEEAGNAFKHAAIVDACAIIRSPSEKKSKELEDILSRLDEKGVYVSTEDKAKADAEKATKEAAGSSGSFNLADEADCQRMAGTLAKANLGSLLSQVLTEARTVESPDVLANFAGTLGGILTARFDKATILGIMKAAAIAEETASKQNADAVKAGESANLAPGVGLIKA